MDITTEKKCKPDAKGSLFKGLGRWAMAIHSLSPTHVAARLRADADASVVSAQILRCLQNESSEAETCVALNNAWGVYGAEPFKLAMSQQLWCVPEFKVRNDDLHLLKLISPAESLSLLGSPMWITRLGAMVPQEMWSRRTHISDALAWHEDSRRLNTASVHVEGVGPLLRVCSGVMMRRNKWDQIFEALSPWLVAPSKLEELACRGLFINHQERLQKFEAWVESKAIAESISVRKVVDLTTLQPARSTRRL